MDYPYDVGAHTRTVTTTSPEAQRWFDRGLNWCFGYHHEEAMVCFEKAIAADPGCAMAHWGVAYAASPPMADFFESYVGVRQHVLIRFGKWREIVAQDLPADRALYCNTVAMMHYAKGVAYAALGDVPAAEAEQALFRAAAKCVPKSRYMHNVSCLETLAIAEAMLEGEIAYRRGEYDAAFNSLRHAIALEDDLPYDEPWGWMQPVRHALGALLLEQDRAAEAELVYREDLGLGGTLPRAQIHPDNLWAMLGLLDCLERRGETVEAPLIRQRVELAAARADIPVSVSCFCARGKAA